jgi:hypothetical protein
VAQVELRCDDLGLACPARPLRDPLSASDREEPAWYLEQYRQWPFREFARRGARVEQRLPEIGRRLYDAVFGTPDAMAVLQPWRLQPGVLRQISILSDVPAAPSLPWELLHDEQGFLVLRTQQPVTILRRLPQSELAAFPALFTPPLRLLLVPARPTSSSVSRAQASAAGRRPRPAARSLRSVRARRRATRVARSPACRP